jgi:hypothetical protein
MVRYIPASTRSESKRERGPASQTEVYDEPASSKAQATLTAILLPFRLEPSVVSSFALSGTVIVSHQRMEGDRFTYTLPFKPLMASCASPSLLKVTKAKPRGIPVSWLKGMACSLSFSTVRGQKETLWMFGDGLLTTSVTELYGSKASRIFLSLEPSDRLLRESVSGILLLCSGAKKRT